MTIELSNDEKINILNQHLRNLLYNKYNLNISLEEANSVAMPSQVSLDSLNLQISDADSQIATLNRLIDEITTK